MDTIPILVHSTQSSILEELKTTLLNTQEQVGDVYNEKVETNVYFDLNNTIQTSYSILSIIATVGGLVAFIDWIVEKVRSLKSEKSEQVITIVCNSICTTITRDTDPDSIRLIINNQMKIETKK